MKKILLGYCLIILVGGILLTLPISTRGEKPTGFTDALFTATSATCVTGLIRFDTFTHWTFFGQAIILSLIQIGGIGFVTIILSMLIIAKRKIGLSSRFIMQNSISAPQVGGIVRMTKFILFGSAIIEATGALLLAFYYCPRLGILKGVWFSVFHSVSAFCNAGFDLMGIRAPYSSLTSVADNWYVNTIIMVLIVVGGLGFFVWHDLLDNKLRFKKLRLHSKLVLLVTGFLIVFGAVGLFFLENTREQYSHLPISEQILTSLFQSVTSRTAGFNSLDIASMTQSGQFLIICLMLIGGSTGSTAGGMKTTTFAVLIINILATVRRKKSLEAFGRRIDDGVVLNVNCIFMMYIILSAIVATIIATVERLPLLSALFESVSAIGTVGLTTGITPGLGLLSKLLLAALMLFGRVGSVTILLALSSEKSVSNAKLPTEKIQVG